MMVRLALWKGVCLLVGIVGASGCSPKKVELNLTEDRLLKIGSAYVNFANRKGQPPKNFDEIKPFLGEDVAADFLASPNDGKEFVIIWGVDYNKLPSVSGDPYTVGGYEKSGVNGKRYVLRFPMGVVMKTDEELRKLAFPPGHKPPV